jgi:hypothetical protein
MVYFKVIFRYILSKEGKIPNPKKILAIVNMLPPKTLKDIHVLNGMA